MSGRHRILALLIALAGPCPVLAQQVPDRDLPMQVETKIPLGEVRGRIDHLAVDLTRKRLFIAELGNDSLAVIDLAAGSVARRVNGLREPQGVAYAPGADTVLVANARDGTVERFGGADLTRLGRTELGADADNLRLDPTSPNLVWVGHRSGRTGALTALDAASGRPAGAPIPLAAHPESFQLAANGPRVFANLPDAGGAVAVLDRASRGQLATWSAPGFGANFPMALDEPGGRLFVAFRGPPTLGVMDLRDGNVLAKLPLCGDADDVFFDARRHRLYAVCGEGVVDVFEDRPPDATGGGSRPMQPHRIARVPTTVGARTGLFVPELDRLFVAARAGPAGPAAVWVFRPEPRQ